MLNKRVYKWLIIVSSLLVVALVLFFFMQINKQSDEKSSSVLDEAKNKIISTTIYTVTQEQLIEGALKGMMQAIKDPYSNYYSSKEAAVQKQQLARERIGIGVEVAEINQKMIVVGTLKNSPAHQAGLLPYDEIVQINNVNVKGKPMEELLLLLQGQENEKVTLSVFRPQMERHFTYELQRKKLSNKTISYQTLKEEQIKFGYLEISLFGEGTAGEWLTALKYFKQQKVNAIIIDVRNNPGGYLQTASQIVSTFQSSKKPFAYLQNARGEIEQLQTEPQKDVNEYTVFLNKIPIALLVNEGSASASEVLAATLKSWKRATLVGTKTFGKGTVQETWQLANKGEIKLSTYKWLTLEQEWIHKEGIAPHIEQQAQPLRNLPTKIIATPYEQGDYAEDIAYIQQILDGLGYSVSRQDGYFDDSTSEAVQQFRTKHNLIGKSEMEATFYQKLFEQFQLKKTDQQYDLQLQMAISYLIHQLAPGT